MQCVVIGRSSMIVSYVTKRVARVVPSVRNYHICNINNGKILFPSASTAGVRFYSTKGKGNGKMNHLEKVPPKKSFIVENDTELTKEPDFTPLPVLSKTDVAKITATEVGSENLNITERDIVEIDSISKELYEMVNTPFAESTFVELKDYNVDKTFNKIKDTLHIDNLPRAIKAIRVLSAQDRVDDALLIWNVIKQDPKQCTKFAWTAYLTTLCTHGKSLQAQQDLKEMILQGHSLDYHVYGVLVNGLVRDGYLDEAYTLTREMTERGKRPNNVIISSLLVGCIKKRQLDRACETFDLMRNYIEEADSISTALMIKVAEMQHRTEQAILFFESLEIHNQPITQGCYHAVMHACAASWRYDVKAFDFFEMMVDSGITPTLTSYHILLEACGKHGDFVKVNDIFRRIHESGLTPTQTTYSLALRAIAEGCGKGLAMPEHPAGDRRLTRKEYERLLQGYEKPTNRDRYSYVRDLRTRNMNDGLGDIEEEEENPLPEVKNEVSIKKMVNDAAEKMTRPLAEDILEEMKEGLAATEKTELQTRTGGLAKEEIDDMMAKVQGIVKGDSLNSTNAVSGKDPVEVKPSLREKVNEIVTNDYLIEQKENNNPIEGSKDVLTNELDTIEKVGRDLITTEYKKNGGDVNHIDYQSPEWTAAMQKVMSTNTELQSSIQNMVKVRMGITAVAGGKLLEQKEEADKEFRKELVFLQSCFKENPEIASKMTRLRMAKEIKEDVLQKYNILQQVEPNRIYRPPMECYSLMIPNRVRDLDDYWHRLYKNDPTVPPLKPYLLHEGEKLWKQILEMSGNQPSLVSLNNRLGLYTKGCYLKRAENAFRDIEKYGKKPDVFSYYEIITMYSKTKHLKEAASMMREMQLKGLTPSPDTYGEIVLGLSRVGDVNTALAVMTDIKRQGLPFPKERYLRPLRLHLHKMQLDDHPSMPEDEERIRRKEYHDAVRKDGRKSNSKVLHALNAK